MALLFRLVLIVAVGCVAFGLAVTAGEYPAVWLVVGWMAYRKMKWWRPAGWAYGTAKMASLEAISRGGFFSRDGVVLGIPIIDRPSLTDGVRKLFSPVIDSGMACRLFLTACFGTKWDGGRPLRLTSFNHILTCAATGRGKGVSVVIPNLLAYSGSVVVTDPKAENFKLSSGYRCSQMGHKILRFDPFQLCGPNADSFNPLDCIDENAEDFLDQCRDLANMLIIRTGKEENPFFNDAAELVVSGCIAFVCACETDRSDRNFRTVRAMVSSPESLEAATEEMLATEGFDGVISRLGGLLSWFTGETRDSVLSTVHMHTSFLDSPAVARSLASSSFDPMDLKRKRVSLYLVFPHDRLKSLAGLNRLITGTVIRSITRGAADERNKVLFILDEAAHLGKMQVIEEAVTLMRGMGIRLWMIFQSIGQLRECYGEKADVVLDNFDTQQYFGINAYESAEAISKRIGDHSVTVVSRNDTTGRSWQSGGDAAGPKGVNHSTGSSITFSEIGRRLLKPEEIITLPDDVALLFHRNLPVIPTRLVRYYNSPHFKRGGSRAPSGKRVSALLLILVLTLGGGLVAVITRELFHPALEDDFPFPVPSVDGRMLRPASPDPWPPYQPGDTPYRMGGGMGRNVRYP